MNNDDDSSWSWLGAAVIGFAIVAGIFVGWPLIIHWIARGLF